MQRSSPLSWRDPHVAQHDVGPIVGDERERPVPRSVAVADDLHLVGKCAEHRLEAVQHHLVVVDQDESQRGRSSAPAWAQSSYAGRRASPGHEDHPAFHPQGEGAIARPVPKSSDRAKAVMTEPIPSAAARSSPSVLPGGLRPPRRRGAAALERAGVDRIQWDVMDGVFVPNLTFGPDVIAAAAEHARSPFEAHLMVLTRTTLAERYVEAGCELVIVHAEACTHLHRTLGRIRELGASRSSGPQPAHAGRGRRNTCWTRPTWSW